MRRLEVLLASASPRRRALLEALGHSVTTALIEIDEGERAGESAADYLVRVVDDKLTAARRVASLEPWDVRLVADTIVVLDGRILHKPADDADGARMLRALAGRAHEVTTRFAIEARGGAVHRESVTTEVTFRAIDDDEIAWYVATGEGRDKAGGYAIQGHGAAFVLRLHGSYGAVVGLPSCEVAMALRGLVSQPSPQAARHSDSS